MFKLLKIILGVITTILFFILTGISGVFTFDEAFHCAGRIASISFFIFIFLLYFEAYRKEVFNKLVIYCTSIFALILAYNGFKGCVKIQYDIAIAIMCVSLIIFYVLFKHHRSN